MVELRSFTNFDPPELVALWRRCKLAPGGVEAHPVYVAEMLVFGQLQFEPRHLHVAELEGKIVGFAHGGFSRNPQQWGVDRRTGVVCAVLVDPLHRRQGIGRALVQRCASGLTQAGAVTVLAGEAGESSPFYLGLYGGAESAGFLQTTLDAEPFFTGIGWRPQASHTLYRRKVDIGGDPIDAKLLTLRRQYELETRDLPHDVDWWWMTRVGRFDTTTYVLVSTKTRQVQAELTAWEMQPQSQERRCRTVGLVKPWISPGLDEPLHLKLLYQEVIKRLRTEFIDVVETVVPSTAKSLDTTMTWLRFSPVDTGLVYHPPA